MIHPDRNLPQSLVSLEFKDQESENLGLNEQPFEKVLYHHWRSEDFLDKQKKGQEEYQNLHHAAIEMSEAEMAYHLMMQMRNKLICAYRHLLNKGHRA